MFEIHRLCVRKIKKEKSKKMNYKKKWKRKIGVGGQVRKN
jgi:hypothetical protein